MCFKTYLIQHTLICTWSDVILVSTINVQIVFTIANIFTISVTIAAIYVSSRVRCGGVRRRVYALTTLPTDPVHLRELAQQHRRVGAGRQVEVEKEA